MPQLIVNKYDGTLLFDTSKITYGLVKSGYLAYSSSWTRRTLRSAQLDPREGSNWFPSTEIYDPSRYDQQYSFTVPNARSPIVFLVGSGCLNGTTVSGTSKTFHYTNADSNTRYYCFDLMNNDQPGAPYLKTFDASGVLTFNSLQPPLNVIGAVQPTGPGPTGKYGVQLPYIGAYPVARTVTTDYFTVKQDYRLDVNLTGGVEYAAHLPWSRGAGCVDSNASTSVRYASIEGVYGRVGGITFLFGASAGTTIQIGVAPSPAGMYDVPSDRIPIALVITTANYPFPFN